MNASLPTGTVTFLFTDIQGSTPLWEREPGKMAAALQIHNRVLKQAIETNGGVVFKTVGDAFQAVFPTATQALQAVIDGQRALQAAAWNDLGVLKVRMGLHTGEAQLDPGGDEYAVSHTKNRIGRIHSIAHGGQILISAQTYGLVSHNLPEGVSLEDMGEHHLKGMQWPEHLYQVCAPGLQEDFPPLATGDTHPNNLPVQLTSFIGREKEIAAVVDLLSKHRLVTLTGSGGTGKTRLSLRVADEVLSAYPDGAWLVELAPLADPLKVTQAVAAAIGLQEVGTLPILEILKDYIKNRRLLLVLDNCEHMLEACSHLVDILLRTGQRVSILTSSREALGVGGEASYRVPEFSVPDLRHLPALEEITHSEAVRLFVERASLVKAGFGVTSQNAQAIVQICDRLDGIPLAIELAAARVAALSAEKIAARLTDRFHLLTGGSRTALPRQQTLRASIDWSYNQLPKAERLLLIRLSIFAGGWTLEAAESICAQDGLEEAEILDILTSLVKKSLVTFASETPGDTEQESRYGMLETIRQYGREKLLEGEDATRLRSRHLDYYQRMAQQGVSKFNGLFHRAEFWLNIELDNLRVALEWGLVGGSLEVYLNGFRLITDLCLVEVNLGSDESIDWLDRYRAQPEWSKAAPIELHAHALRDYGILRFWRGDFAGAIQASLEAVALYQQLEDFQSQVFCMGYQSVAINFTGDQAAQLACVNEAIAVAKQAGLYEENKASLTEVLGFYHLHNDIEQAKKWLIDSVAAREKIGDRLGMVSPLRYLGAIASAQGEYERADGYLTKAVGISREMKSSRTLFYDLSANGDHAHRVERYAEAEAIFQEAASIAEKMGFRNGYVWCTHHRCVAIRRQGQLERAQRLISQCLQLAQEYHFEDLVVECLAAMAGLAADQGSLEESARWLGAVEAQLAQVGVGPVCQLELSMDTGAVRAALGEGDYQAAWERGKTLSLEQALEEARIFCLGE